MKKTKFIINLILILAIVLSGCQISNKMEKSSKSIFAMDTVMELTIYSDSSLIAADTLNEAEAKIKEYDQLFSVTNEASDISKLNKSGKAEVSKVAYDLLKKAVWLSSETDGAMDITIYPLVKLWGFTGEEQRVPAETEIEKTLSLLDFSAVCLYDGDMVETKGNQQIDLGSTAKGYTSDAVIDFFREKGITSAIVSLGGNVQTLGYKPDGSEWNIAIKNGNSDGFIGGVKVHDKAVVTSGVYERYFEENGVRYHHIMDPSTGYPVKNGLVSVSVIGENGFECDALSTALFVMGIEKATEYLKSHDSVDAIFQDEDGNIYITPGLGGSFVAEDLYKNRVITINLD